MASGVTSLSGLAGRLGGAILPSVLRVQFEFILPLLAATGMSGSGALVMVSAGSAWSVLVRAGEAGHSSPLVRTLGENAGASGFKTTRGVA